MIACNNYVINSPNTSTIIQFNGNGKASKKQRVKLSYWVINVNQ